MADVQTERYATMMVRLKNRPWHNLFDEEGHVLIGIRGKRGVAVEGSDGEQIGCDLIELEPGAAFPLHVHKGDHVLYALAGRGNVTVNETISPFEAGSLFYIAAEYPHAVGTYAEETEPFLVLAFGHPHKDLTALDRMQLVQEE